MYGMCGMYGMLTIKNGLSTTNKWLTSQTAWRTTLCQVPGCSACQSSAGAAEAQPTTVCE
jgi:hypothetical protein